MGSETTNELERIARDALIETEAEIERLRRDQKKAETLAAHLRGILDGDGKLVSPPALPEPAANIEIQRPVKFRDAIRDVVDNSTGPVSINAVTHHVKAKGFSDGGATPLEVRVGNELFKLSKAGEIARSSRGHYESNK